MHRSWLALGGVVVALLLTGCGSPSVEQSSSLSSGAPVAYTTPPRAAAPIQAKGDPVDPSSTFKLVTALQSFGLDLLRAEAKAQPEGKPFCMSLMQKQASHSDWYRNCSCIG